MVWFWVGWGSFKGGLTTSSPVLGVHMVRIIALACVGKILSRMCSGPHEVLSTSSVITRL